MHIMLPLLILGPHDSKVTVGLRKLYNWHCRYQNRKQNMLQNNLQLTITISTICAEYCRSLVFNWTYASKHQQ